MKTFIAKSETSKKILNVARMATSVPVNVLIIGEVGVGKTILAQEILPNTNKFDAKNLEEMIVQRTINLNDYNELIITNINNLLNKKEFFENLKKLKIVATTNFISNDIETHFAIKIDIPPLEEREEDLAELIKIYSNQAQEIYDVDIDIEKIDVDLQTNGISLKKSIFKNTLLKSLNDDDMLKTLEYFIYNKLEDHKEYKELLGYFEIPLLNAAKKQYKSQLKMATKLNINRITLRKKLDLYFGES